MAKTIQYCKVKKLKNKIKWEKKEKKKKRRKNSTYKWIHTAKLHVVQGAAFLLLPKCIF